jgi:hypothetical protein
MLLNVVIVLALHQRFRLTAGTFSVTRVLNVSLNGRNARAYVYIYIYIRVCYIKINMHFFV